MDEGDALGVGGGEVMRVTELEGGAECEGDVKDPTAARSEGAKPEERA